VLVARPTPKRSVASRSWRDALVAAARRASTSASDAISAPCAWTAVRPARRESLSAPSEALEREREALLSARVGEQRSVERERELHAHVPGARNSVVCGKMRVFGFA
jgi:hypothetical protein